jgi:hypothetical protein
MDCFIIFLAALAGAFVWRLGGGAFTSITGLNFGSDAARALRAMLAGLLPVMWFAPGVPVLFIGICIGGWGPFQGMGLPVSGRPEPSWKRWLPQLLGFKAGTTAHDFIGMAESGLCCMAPLALLYGWFDWRIGAWLLACGVGFAPCYLLARLPWPAVPKFAEGQEWGEVFTGALLGAAFVVIAMTINPSAASWRVL